VRAVNAPDLSGKVRGESVVVHGVRASDADRDTLLHMLGVLDEAVEINGRAARSKSHTTTRAALLAEWADRLWTLAWAGTLIVCGMRIGKQFTSAQAADLLIVLWGMFGSVQFVDKAGAAVGAVVGKWREPKA
jgi:hypothetical protein